MCLCSCLSYAASKSYFYAPYYIVTSGLSGSNHSFFAHNLIKIHDFRGRNFTEQSLSLSLQVLSEHFPFY
jgi:hypothetical protein